MSDENINMAAEPAPEENSASEAVDNTVENTEPEAKQEPQKKKGVPLNARFRQLTTQRREDQARIQELEGKIRENEKAALIEEPDKNNYNDPDDYYQQKDKFTNQQKRESDIQAVEDYKNNQRYQKEQNKIQTVFNNYKNTDRPKAVEEYKDYAKSEQELGKAVFDYKIPELEKDILSSKVNAAIVDFLGNDLEKLEELAYMYQTDPQQAARSLGRLEASLGKAPTKKGLAPEPLPKTGGGAGAVTKSVAEMSQKEYNIYKKNGG